MKCFTIKKPDEVKPGIRPDDIRDLLTPALRKRKQILTAHLDFELFPGFTYEMFGNKGTIGPDLYGFGLPTLTEKQTAHGKRMSKNSICVLFDHTIFHLDKTEGDESRSLWMNHRLELTVTTPQKFRLRETGTGKVYELDTSGKLRITVV